LSTGIIDPVWLKRLLLHKEGEQVQDIYFALVGEEAVADIGDAVQGDTPAATGDPSKRTAVGTGTG
jgi:hypothetical protein